MDSENWNIIVTLELIYHAKKMVLYVTFTFLQSVVSLLFNRVFSL